MRSILNLILALSLLSFGAVLGWQAKSIHAAVEQNPIAKLFIRK